jgi:hypothetical protein
MSPLTMPTPLTVLTVRVQGSLLLLLLSSDPVKKMNVSTVSTVSVPFNLGKQC